MSRGEGRSPSPILVCAVSCTLGLGRVHGVEKMWLHMPSPLILVTSAKLGTGVVPASGSV